METNISERPELLASGRKLVLFTPQGIANVLGADLAGRDLKIMKELIDNAIGGAEHTNRAPEVRINITRDRVIVADNGCGYPFDTLQTTLQDFDLNAGENVHRPAPTRGRIGSATKVISAAVWAAYHDSARVTYTTPLFSREVRTRPDFATGEVDVRFPQVSASLPSVGTIVSVPRICPAATDGPDPFPATVHDKLILPYALFNPHARFTLSEGATDSDPLNVGPLHPGWSGWKALDLVDPRWFESNDKWHLYLCALRAGRGGDTLTLHDVLKKLDGFSAYGVREAVLANAKVGKETTLDALIYDSDREAALLGEAQRRARPIPSSRFGYLREKLMEQFLRTHYGCTRAWAPRARSGNAAEDHAYVSEVAVGLRLPGRPFELLVGVNGSPLLDELRILDVMDNNDVWHDLKNLLQDRLIFGQRENLVVVVRLVDPWIQYEDNETKARAQPCEAAARAVRDMIVSATRRWMRVTKSRPAGTRVDGQMYESLLYDKPRYSWRELFFDVLEDAYQKALIVPDPEEDPDGPYAYVRDIFYSARALIWLRRQLAVPPTVYDDFRETILPDFQQEHRAIAGSWRVFKGARGLQYETRTGRMTALGTAEILADHRRWTSDIPETLDAKKIVEAQSSAPTYGPANRAALYMYCEKMGVLDGLRADGTTDRRDITAGTGQGFASDAARQEAEWHAQLRVPTGLMTDWDLAGLRMTRAFMTDVKHYTYTTRPRFVHIGLRLDQIEAILERRREEDGLTHTIDEMLEVQELKFDPRFELEDLATAQEIAIMDPQKGVDDKWRIRRVELNNLTPAERSWLVERRLDELAIKRVLPSEDILAKNWRRLWQLEDLRAAFHNVQHRDNPVPTPAAPVGPPPHLRDKVRRVQQRTDLSWDLAEQRIVVRTWRAIAGKSRANTIARIHALDAGGGAR